MKSSLLNLFLFGFLLFAFSSCSEGESNQQNDDQSQTEDNGSDETTSDEKVNNNGPFEIKSGVIQYEDMNLEGDLKAELSLYFDNYGSLVKLEETADGETSVYIFNDATKKGVTMFPGRKPSKIMMRQGEINRFVALRSTSGYVQQDNEDLLGKTCEVFANNATSAEGESQNTYWLHKGIVMKEINRLGMGYEFEAVSLQEKDLDKSTFSLPDGIEMPHDIF